MENVGGLYAGAPVITKFVSLSCRKKELTYVLKHGSGIRCLTLTFRHSNDEYCLQITIFYAQQTNKEVHQEQKSTKEC